MALLMTSMMMMAAPSMSMAANLTIDAASTTSSPEWHWIHVDQMGYGLWTLPYHLYRCRLYLCLSVSLSRYSIKRRMMMAMVALFATAASCCSSPLFVSAYALGKRSSTTSSSTSYHRSMHGMEVTIVVASPSVASAIVVVDVDG